MKIINHDKRVGSNMESQRRESTLSCNIQHPNVVTTYKVRAALTRRMRMPGMLLRAACRCMPYRGHQQLAAALWQKTGAGELLQLTFVPSAAKTAGRRMCAGCGDGHAAPWVWGLPGTL